MARHIRSESPIELSLGVDLTGGENWRPETVTQYAWDETTEDNWMHTQAEVQATGNMLLLVLKGYHPFDTQGGATLFDSVRVADLGP
jgi:hypothetical protein